MLLLTGANGQLGRSLAAILPDALCAGSADLDITNADAVARYVEAHGVQKIINCAAYTAVDAAEDNVDRAFLVNAKALENLAKTGADIIHISTDYVFDGTSCKPYVEGDTPNPQSVYGRSKLAGEDALFEHATAGAAVVRTSWVYSQFGNNFLKTMQRLGAERAQLNVVFDQIGTPTFAGDLADVLVKLLPQVTGNTREIYHFSNEGVCSWYDFATAIMQECQLSARVLPIEGKDYPAKATRPFYSVLNKAKIKTALGIEIPHWREGLKSCLIQK